LGAMYPSLPDTVSGGQYALQPYVVSTSNLPPLPRRLYRYLSHERYADDFATGRNIRLSTLASCRAMEVSTGQGDPEEAIHTLLQRGTIGLPPDRPFNPRDVARLARFGLPVSPGGVYAHNAVVDAQIPNAFVLCLSDSLDPDYFREEMGLPFCVEVYKTERAWLLLNMALLNRYDDLVGKAGPIVYGARRRFEDEPDPPGELGFVKPADPFAKQREHRMMWVTPSQHASIAPMFISAPELATCFRRIV
jgi:hypothetical protein